jgi:hypothetical protein
MNFDFFKKNLFVLFLVCLLYQMTIKDLSKYLRDNHPEVFENTELSEFSNTALAFDANNFNFIMMSRAMKLVLNKHNLSKGLPDDDTLATELIGVFIEHL